jgi:hypothetical protein
VIKQEGGHFFISAPNSIIIDREGFLQLIKALVDIGFIEEIDLTSILVRKGLEKNG